MRPKFYFQALLSAVSCGAGIIQTPSALARVADPSKSFPPFTRRLPVVADTKLQVLLSITDGCCLRVREAVALEVKILKVNVACLESLKVRG
jgi:hypothetical protein